MWRIAQLAVFFGWVLVFTIPESAPKGSLFGVALVALALTALTFAPIMWLTSWWTGWKPAPPVKGAFDNLRRPRD